MKKVILWAAAAVLVLIAAVILIPGFTKNTSVFMEDFTVSPGGDSITIRFGISSSMGHLRKAAVCKEENGRLFLDCYSAFGGPNGRIGAKDTFTFPVGKDASVIAVFKGDGRYEDILAKDAAGNWQRTDMRNASVPQQQ